MRTKSGYGLKQIILTVIVVLLFYITSLPQYTCHGEVDTSQLCTALQAVRSQIRLYRIQHNNKLPGATQGVSFVEAMTLKTNADGSLARNPDGSLLKVGGFGPYLKRIPPNPFIRDNIITQYVRWFAKKGNRFDTVEIDGKPGGGDYGWNYNTKTGAFHADDDAHVKL